MIIKLPEEVIRKIAAGEVVAGAFSVVKELVENSLDAGANKVEIEIKNGGKSLIKVGDDGIGMTKDEVLLAIQPHTTSKISSIEDLYNVKTYGFRGEALASIVKVSRTVIFTKKENHSGVKVEIEGGRVISVKEDNIERTGTTIIVRDLFFNVPARRKFLKSSLVEGRMVTEQVQKFLLSRPDVHFIYKKDSTVVYSAPPSDLLVRIAMVLPDSNPRKLLKVLYERDHIKIHGYISTPGNWRKNRSGQIFFVNGRAVLSGELNFALEIGYGETLEKGKHPLGVVFIEVPPKMVDANVHPQKIEVRFSDPQKIKNALIKAVRNTISSSIERELPVKRKKETLRYTVSNPGNLKLKEPELVDIKREFSRNIKPSFVEENLPKYLLILKDRYILAEDEEGLLIIDYHAAHERVLYEKLKEEYEKEGLKSSQLLFPLTVNLDPVQKDTLKSNLEVFKKLGFEIEVEGNISKITSVPKVLLVTHAEEVFLEIIEDLRFERFKGLPDTVQKILSDIACKSAVRTGDMITEDDALEIIRKLYEMKLLSCPHGRPLVFRISYKELDKYFERE